MSHDCNKCNRKYSTKSNLNVHQKSCGVEEKQIWVCEYCDKELTTKNTLQKHLNICTTKKLKLEFKQIIEAKELEFKQHLKDKEFENIQNIKSKHHETNQLITTKELEFIKILNSKEFDFHKTLDAKKLEIKQVLVDKEVIKEQNIILKTAKEYLEKQVKDLQDRLDHFTDKTIEKTSVSKSVTNNNQIQVNFFTKEHIEQQVKDHFSLDHLVQGVKGVAKFTRDYIAKQDNKLIYECRDAARKAFYFTSPDGQKTKDYNGTNLMRFLHRPICDKSLKIYLDAEREVVYLKELKSRTEIEEKNYQIKLYMIDRWPVVVTEVSALDENGFPTELTKLIAV
jgi:hypothetical protein